MLWIPLMWLLRYEVNVMFNAKIVYMSDDYCYALSEYIV